MSEVKNATIQEVIAKRKEHSKRHVDTKLIMKAYNYAVNLHGDQKRKSGTIYYTST